MNNTFKATLVASLLGTAAYADNALIIGNYSNAPDSVSSRLEAAGHTTTIESAMPADISGYEQIWDLRWNESFDQQTTDTYDAFVKDGGFLFITTENPGCCNAQNATKAALITQMGGGDTVIGGEAGSTENTVVDGTNTTYMTEGITVNFMAISAIENDQGTVLIEDANGKVAAMMWVGNAGDLGEDYAGTVITIADINWLAQGFSTEAYAEDNIQALDDIINGVVAGTVAGTISEEGNDTVVVVIVEEPVVEEVEPDMFTLANAVSINVRNLDLQGFSAIRNTHTYDNGKTGETTGISAGGDAPMDNGMMIGGGYANMKTTIEQSSAETNVFEGRLSNNMADSKVTLSARHAMTSYKADGNEVDGTDTLLKLSARATENLLTPYAAYTYGQNKLDGQDAVEYQYTTIGVDMTYKMLTANVEYNTDDVTKMGIGLQHSNEDVDFRIGYNKTSNEWGETSGMEIGLTVNF